MTKLSLMQLTTSGITDRSVSMHSTIPTTIDKKAESPESTQVSRSPPPARTPLDFLFEDDDDKSISIFAEESQEDDAEFADVDCDTSWVQEMEQMSASYQSLPTSTKRSDVLNASSMSLPAFNLQQGQHRHVEGSVSQGELDDSFILGLTQSPSKTSEKATTRSSESALVQPRNVPNVRLPNTSDHGNEKLRVKARHAAEESSSSVGHLMRNMHTNHSSDPNLKFSVPIHSVKDLDFSSAPVVPMTAPTVSRSKVNVSDRRKDKLASMLTSALAVDEGAHVEAPESRLRRQSSANKKVVRRKKPSLSPTPSEEKVASANGTMKRRVRRVASGGPATVRREGGTSTSPTGPRPRRVMRGEKPRPSSARHLSADRPSVPKRPSSARTVTDHAETATGQPSSAATASTGRRRPANKTTVNRRSPRRLDTARSPVRSPVRTGEQTRRRKSASVVATARAGTDSDVAAKAVSAPKHPGQRSDGRRSTQQSVRRKSSTVHPRPGTVSRRRSSGEVPVVRRGKGENRRRSSSNVAEAARLAVRAIAAEEAAKKLRPRRKKSTSKASSLAPPSLAEAARIASMEVAAEEAAAAATGRRNTASPFHKTASNRSNVSPQASRKVSPLRRSAPIRPVDTSNAHPPRKNSPLRKSSPVRPTLKNMDGPMKLSTKFAMAPVVRSEGSVCSSRKSISPKPRRNLDDASIRSMDSWRRDSKSPTKAQDEGSICPSVTSAIEAGMTEDDTVPKPPVRRNSIFRSRSLGGRVSA